MRKNVAQMLIRDTISEAEIDVIASLYEQKIDICRRIQLGKDPLFR